MKLSDTEYSLLRELQQNEKHKRNYVKITVLLMLHLGKSAEEIGLCLGIRATTVSNYEKKYEQLGLDSYLEDNYVAYQGKLTPEEQALVVQELSENLYQNTAQMVHFISDKACIYVVCDNARYYKNKQRQGMPCLYYKSSCRVAR